MVDSNGNGWMRSDPMLSIGVFSKRSRLSIKALRLYDRQGLLVPAHIDPSSGYRHYRESQLDTARLIVMLRRLEMPLGLIREILSSPRPVAVELVAGYWDSVERRLSYQRELASHLWVQFSGNHGGYEAFPVAEREVPEQLVLTELRFVTEPELSDWVMEGMGRLFTAAEEYGGVIGPTMIVFQGQVDEDGDGPVELCAPIDPSVKETPGMTSRRELAHWEAFTRITKAQNEYPQILSAYDAVAYWIDTNEKVAIGYPREIYFADVRNSEPNEEVCDIAQPIR
jgi:DNA-binding transcriptional MerR regulator